MKDSSSKITQYSYGWFGRTIRVTDNGKLLAEYSYQKVKSVQRFLFGFDVLKSCFNRLSFYIIGNSRFIQSDSASFKKKRYYSVYGATAKNIYNVIMICEKSVDVRVQRIFHFYYEKTNFSNYILQKNKLFYKNVIISSEKFKKCIIFL